MFFQQPKQLSNWKKINNRGLLIAGKIISNLKINY